MNRDLRQNLRHRAKLPRGPRPERLHQLLIVRLD